MNTTLFSYSQLAPGMVEYFFEYMPYIERETFIKNGKKMNIEEQIIFLARISNPMNQFKDLSGSKLIRYLINNHHWSPFEMVSATVLIDTTRDISRQIIRHRSFSYQEFSQRYADPTQLDYVLRPARLQDEKNRQNSVEVDDEKLHSLWKEKQLAVVNLARETYKWAADRGIAKELARVVLPEGNTATKLYMAGTMRSWIHYCGLRTGNGTQREHIDVASHVTKEIETAFPSFKWILDRKDEG